MAKLLLARGWTLPRLTFALPRQIGTVRVGEPALMLILLGVGLLTHGLNMYHYPSFTARDDEGIYTAQAWAVLRLGQLSPYTYVYDHAPGGWLLLAAWMALTGGPDSFGTTIDSGRVLMLLLHLTMVPLLYHLSRKLGASVAAAALGSLLFSVSPLAIYYQRLMLLDSLMLFWVLLSLDLLLDGWGRLSRIALSGACFGLALLSKETAVFLLPAMLYIAVQDRRQHQGRFAVGIWLVPMLAVTSWYPLYALLKNELLPTGQTQSVVSGYGATGISLIDSLRWQIGRDGGGLLNGENQFWQRVRTDWLPLDRLLPIGGSVAILLNLARGLRDRRALAAGLLGALPLWYLARGGIVLDFYVLFAIPFLCLNLALVLGPLLERLPRQWAGVVGLVLALGLAVGYLQAGTLVPLFSERRSQVGRDALAWIKAQVPADSLIVTGDDLWPDLHEPGPGGPAFPNAHSHWKVAADPAIRSGVFRDDWRTVDYLIVSPDLRDTFAASNNTIAVEALKNAELVRAWQDDQTRLELWKVDRPGRTEAALLAGSAQFMRDQFERDGAYVDRSGAVTSEAQSYALLRAVWGDDRASFDRVWRWTQANLVDPESHLAWLWRDGSVVDNASATDADTDTALALLLGSRRWEDQSLLTAAQRLISEIWRHDVVVLAGTPYVTAGDWATDGAILALNPSYFAPYAYELFQQVDPEHDWRGAIDSSYRVLFEVSALELGTPHPAGLPPDWVGLDRTTGGLVPLVLNDADTTRYGYDAARTYWRIALDNRWRNDGRAAAYLGLAGFLRDEVERDGAPRAVYSRGGAPLESGTSMVSTAGALAAFQVMRAELGRKLFVQEVVANAAHNGDRVYWGDPTDLYGQSWGWFATALYANALPNLWSAH